MGVLNDLLARVRDLDRDIGSAVRDVVVRHEDDIMAMQLAQLFAGKASSGDDIRPYYSEDLKPGGYFKDVEAAKRYSVWKGDISPYSAGRNPDAPNLYISGKFHSELGAEFGSETVAVVGLTPYPKGIVAKYGLSTFGLTRESWGRIFAERGGYGELMDIVRKRIYGNR